MSDTSNKLATVAQVKKIKDEIVQADWSESDTNSKAYIRNKPVITQTLDMITPKVDTVAEDYISFDKSNFSDVEWYTAVTCNYAIALYDGDTYITTFSFEKIRRYVSRGDTTYDLPGNYGIICVSNRTSLISFPSGNGYNRVKFVYSAMISNLPSVYPFTDIFNEEVSCPSDDFVVAYSGRNNPMIPCNTVKIKDSSTNISQQYTVEVADNTLTLTGTSDETRYFRFADDSLYKTVVSASGKATATSTRLTVEEVNALTEQVYTSNIVFFKNDELAPTLKDIVYKIVDAYSAYGYYYFTTIASDRTNTNCSITTLCVRSFNRDV